MAGSLWERLENASGFPLRVLVSLTSRCPLTCAHCYVEHTSGDRELSLDALEALFDELGRLGVFQLSLTGGEPALRPDLEAIVAAAWERRFLISLKTSAALLDAAAVTRLRELGLASLHVSLYHVDPEAHDRFVGMPGAWRRAVEALDTFRALGGLPFVSVVVMAWNAPAVRELVELCDGRRWSLTVDPKLVHANSGRRDPIRLRAEGAVLAEAMRSVPGAVRRFPAPTSGQPLCNAGSSSLYVRHDGEVWLCPILPVTIGKIGERPLRDIWLASDLRKRLSALTWADGGECLECRYSRFCERCPGEAFQEHGAIERPAAADCVVAEAYSLIWPRAAVSG